MQRVSILGALLLLSFVTHRPQSFSGCLPESIKPADVVTSRLVESSKAVKKVTVEEKLIQLKASCKNGRLVDAAGREIRFFRLEGCWGNPPADYQEILQRQSDELDRLKRHYTVIEMTCNADGVARP
ncbi:MAG TPA: hypothetical protein VN937_25145 [Blastocatellia bacterium]|nr:hypothetical protein [Blastocatellia bacterium]